MKLLTINPDTQEIDLNREWLHLIPEFSRLIRRDKGQTGERGDYRGDKKLHARKEITFIYFMEDFTSPLRDWEDDRKLEEALRSSQLGKGDIDKEVVAAQEFYREFIRKCAPSLHTLDALYIGRTELNRYFKEVNFKEVDKLGKSKYTAKEYINNIKDLPAMNRAVKEYERMVDEELREHTGVRGKNVLGLMEGQRTQGWDEGDAPGTDKFSSPKHEEIEV